MYSVKESSNSRILKERRKEERKGSSERDKLLFYFLYPEHCAMGGSRNLFLLKTSCTMV
jgi:hypothetical protein